MKPRNKILVGILITVGVFFSVRVSIGLYLMNQYTLLGDAFDNNPFAVLEAASRIAVSQIMSTPTKRLILKT